MNFAEIWTLLADRHFERARSQAPAWERTVFEALPALPALPHKIFVRTTLPQAEPAEPAIHCCGDNRFVRKS